MRTLPKMKKVAMSLVTVVILLSGQSAFAAGWTTDIEFYAEKARSAAEFAKQAKTQLDNFKQMTSNFMGVGDLIGQQYAQLGSVLNSGFSGLSSSIMNNLKAASQQSAASNQAVVKAANNVRQDSVDNTALAGVLSQQPAGTLENSQREPGKVVMDKTAAEIASMQGLDNPTAAIVQQTTLDLQHRQVDSMNVVSYFDQPVSGAFPCKTQAKCTIIMALQESNAAHVDRLQKEVVERGQYWLQEKKDGNVAIADAFYNNVWTAGLPAGTDKTTVSPSVFAKFLSPAPMIPVAFSHDENRGALTVLQGSVLADVLLGVNEMIEISKYSETIDSNAKATQSKIMTRFARAQLARAAMVAVTSRELSDAMNSEFRACVVRPNQTDAIGASVQQHLVNVQYLLRCSNMSLLHMRRIQMEQSRLLATMLATMLDQMSNTDFGDASSVKTGN
jgi:hypothetical protein